MVVKVHKTNAAIAIKPVFHSFSELKAAIIPNTVQIIPLIEAEYLNEVKSNLSPLLTLFLATIAPNHNENKNEITSPTMAFPKVTSIIIVSRPSPENIEGKNIVIAIIPSPNGNPIR